MTIVLEDFALQHLLLAVGRHDKIVWVWSIAVVGEGQSMRALKHSRGTLVCGHVLKSDKARDQEIVRVVLNIGMDLFGYSMLWTGNTNTKFLEDSDPAQNLPLDHSIPGGKLWRLPPPVESHFRGRAAGCVECDQL